MRRDLHVVGVVRPFVRQFFPSPIEIVYPYLSAWTRQWKYKQMGFEQESCALDIGPITYRVMKRVY